MFTGLVRERGRIALPPQRSEQGGLRLRISHSAALAEQLGLGASLAVSGVCLTLVAQGVDWSEVELSPETLHRTTLGELVAGDAVNLEPALRLGEPLGGHWVQGHVDGVLRLLARRDLQAHRELVFELPAAWRGFVVEKGSVTLDGVSLTVAHLYDHYPTASDLSSAFDVALIPHTLEITNLDRLEPGGRVNFEVDILAKYVQRSLSQSGALPQ